MNFYIFDFFKNSKSFLEEILFQQKFVPNLNDTSKLTLKQFPKVMIQNFFRLITAIRTRTRRTTIPPTAPAIIPGV